MKLRLANSKPKNLIRLIVSFTIPVRLQIIGSIAAGLLFAAANAAFYYSVQPALQWMLDGDGKIELLVVLLVVFYLVKGLLYFASEYQAIAAIQDIVLLVRKRFLHNYLRQLHDGSMQGEEAGKFFEDINLMCGSVKLFTSSLVKELLTVIGLVLVLTALAPKLAVIMFLIYAATGFPIYWLGRRMRAAAQVSRLVNAKLLGRVVELFRFKKEILSQAADEFAIKSIQPLLQKDLKELKRVSKLDRMAPVLAEFVAVLGLGCALLLFGKELFSQLSLSSAVAFGAANIALYAPLRSLGSFNAGLQRALASAARLQPLLALPDKSQAAIPYEREIHLSMNSCPLGSGKPILANVGLTLHPGNRIAVVGPNGAGKTTLLHCLAGLRRFEGEYTIDGQQLYLSERGTWPDWIAFAGSEPALFNATLRENLVLSQNKSDTVLQTALRNVKLESRLTSAGLSLDSNIGETGEKLSLGMRQRLVLARLMLRRPKLVLLDEVFAAIEPRDVLPVFKLISEAWRDATIVITTTEQTLVEKMDKVIFMWDGSVAASGDHQTLLHEQPIYQNFWKIEHESLPHGISAAARN